MNQKQIQELFNKGNKIIIGSRYIPDIQELLVIAIVRTDCTQYKEVDYDFDYMMIAEHILLSTDSNLMGSIKDAIDNISLIDEKTTNVDPIDKDKCFAVASMGEVSSMDEPEYYFKYTRINTAQDLPENLDNVFVALDNTNIFKTKINYIEDIVNKYNIESNKFDSYANF